jgi:hypothetical protein
MTLRRIRRAPGAANDAAHFTPSTLSRWIARANQTLLGRDDVHGNAVGRASSSGAISDHLQLALETIRRVTSEAA